MRPNVYHLLPNKTNSRSEESVDEECEVLEIRLEDALGPADCGPMVQPSVVAQQLQVNLPARPLLSKPEPVRAQPPHLVPAPA